MSGAPGLVRRAAAELVGTGLLVAAVVGSGIAASRLSPGDVGVQLAENAAATAAVLAVIILLVGPVSGAHLNPAVSLADWLSSRRRDTGLSGPELGVYTLAQTTGAMAGAVLANLMFDLPAVTVAATDRNGAHLWLAETVATAGLVALVAALVRTGRTTLAPAAVAAWIGGAYWFTSSTSFANPAVTVARMLSDTFAGIAPASVPGFVAAQLVGVIAGLGLATLLHPAATPQLQPPPRVAPQVAGESGQVQAPPEESRAPF